MTSTYKALVSGECKTPGCGAWTGYGTCDYCADCVRSRKTNNMTCELPGCTTVFKRQGTSRYCLPHRALSPKERRRAGV